MKTTYAVLGAGMQGTAAAYDLAKFANPERVLMLDISLDQATHNAHRVNQLVGSAICEPGQASALNCEQLARTLEPVDVCLSCVPYWMHPRVADACISAKTSMLDLGGNTDITLESLKKDEEAKHVGVSIVPDTGLAPGLVNSLGLYLLEQLDEAESIKLYCGVLPQHPVPPFNYKLTFNIEGLVTEYDFQAVTLRDGSIHLVDTLTELEELRIDELGEMEAFVTSGGTSTAPYTFQGRVRDYEYKTIRYPGHCERIKIFKDFGFWSQEPEIVDGVSVVPRHLFYKVFGRELAKIEDQDLCAVRGVGIGAKDGKPARLQVDIFDKEDEVTGFTSMERLTGFSMAIYAHAVAEGVVPHGAIRYENAMTGARFVDELRKRGIAVRETAG